MCLPGAEGEGNGELVFNRYRAIEEDEEFWRWMVVIVVQQKELNATEL